MLSLPLQEEVVLFVCSLDLGGKTYSVHLNSFPELPNRAVQPVVGQQSTVLYNYTVLYLTVLLYFSLVVLYCTSAVLLYICTVVYSSGAILYCTSVQ